jgi:hypothetical protein
MLRWEKTMMEPMFLREVEMAEGGDGYAELVRLHGGASEAQREVLNLRVPARNGELQLNCRKDY